MVLYYLPLEPYKERYSEQWAAPKTGWLERQWIKNKIPYFRIEGDNPEQRPIRSGVVLDASRRCKFAMSQVAKVVDLIEDGTITDKDIVYFDDFWHPGIESLPYCFDIYKVHPETFAFLHAQSVDEFDFTYPMRKWMRHFETGIGTFLTGIFTSCPTLKKLIVEGGIAPKEKVYDTGHPFCSEEVAERMPRYQLIERENNVVWSSRWDSEKQPRFFMEVAQTILSNPEFPDARFIVCTGSNSLRSNNPVLVNEAKMMQQAWPNRFVIREDLTKEQYYSLLAYSKVQFNCALQDFVAITLLESSVAGCYPVYPDFRSFPETFTYNGKCYTEYMYSPWSVDSAVDRTLAILEQEDLWTPEKRKERAWIHERFDSAWRLQLDIMQGYNWINPFTGKGEYVNG